MPVYEYACKACDHHLEVSQSFKDEPLTTCPVCGGPLRKVFGSIGIVLKGSGFYRTDSRTPGKKPEKVESDKAATGGDKAATGGEKASTGGDKAAAGGDGAGSGAKSTGTSESAKPSQAAKTA